jgi:hypothetical protein
MFWQASHEHLVAIPVFEAWETQSDVFFLQHIVRVRPHSLCVDLTLDICEVFMCRNWVVRIVL